MSARRLRVYVAGAYSANNVLGVLNNIREGLRWSVEVFLRGHAPFAPWLDFQFQLMLRPGEHLSVPDYYDYSMAWLEPADIVFVTPGWENSTGTRKEIDRATELGIPVVYSLEDLDRLVELINSSAGEGGSVYIGPYKMDGAWWNFRPMVPGNRAAREWMERASKMICEMKDALEAAHGALGEHPDSPVDLAERISELRHEARAGFHRHTETIMRQGAGTPVLDSAGTQRTGDTICGAGTLARPELWGPGDPSPGDPCALTDAWAAVAELDLHGDIDSMTLAQVIHELGGMLKAQEPERRRMTDEIASLRAVLAVRESENECMRSEIAGLIGAVNHNARRAREENERAKRELAIADRLRHAILWALGEGDDFPDKASHQGNYWWRPQLRKLAGMEHFSPLQEETNAVQEC